MLKITAAVFSGRPNPVWFVGDDGESRAALSSLASERHLVRLIRARILPAGAAIVDAILERYGVDGLRVSEAGIREGTILAVDHAGPAWRDRLAELTHGWQL